MTAPDLSLGLGNRTRLKNLLDIILIELIFVAVVALGIGIWQLVDVNRELRKHRDSESSRDESND
jgi:uncharacterized membrane protein YidH (DUF202 family)